MKLKNDVSGYFYIFGTQENMIRVIISSVKLLKRIEGENLNVGFSINLLQG